MACRLNLGTSVFLMICLLWCPSMARIPWECALRGLILAGDTWNSLYKYEFSDCALHFQAAEFKSPLIPMPFTVCLNQARGSPSNTEWNEEKHFCLLLLFGKVQHMCSLTVPVAAVSLNKTPRLQQVKTPSAAKNMARREMSAKFPHLFIVIPTYTQLNWTKNNTALFLKECVAVYNI